MGLVLNWRQVFEIDDSRYSKKNFWRYNMVQTNERDSDPVLSSSPERTMYGIFRNNNKKKTGKTLKFFPRQRYLAYDNRMKFSSSKSIICGEKIIAFIIFFHWNRRRRNFIWWRITDSSSYKILSDEESHLVRLSIRNFQEFIQCFSKLVTSKIDVCSILYRSQTSKYQQWSDSSR